MVLLILTVFFKYFFVSTSVYSLKTTHRSSRTKMLFHVRFQNDQKADDFSNNVRVLRKPFAKKNLFQNVFTQNTISRVRSDPRVLFIRDCRRRERRGTRELVQTRSAVCSGIVLKVNCAECIYTRSRTPARETSCRVCRSRDN